MSATGFTAIAALFVFDAGKDNIASGGVAVEKIASCAGFSMEAVAECSVIGLGVILGGGHGQVRWYNSVPKLRRNSLGNTGYLHSFLVRIFPQPPTTIMKNIDKQSLVSALRNR
jgi:hypothetical protein